jgi:hypothetical protein
VLVFLGISALTACERRAQAPRIDEQMPQTWNFNDVLKAGMASGPTIFSLNVSAVERQGEVYLFCRLRNVSDQTVRLDDARLPWNTLGMLTAIAFDSNGKQLRTHLSLGGIFTEGSYDDMAPGEELTGSIHLEEFLNASERPSSGDVTLRWVYIPRLEKPAMGLRAITGDTLLPGRLR